MSIPRRPIWSTTRSRSGAGLVSDTFVSLPRLRFEPFEHQRQAAQTVLRRMRGRAILADEVGLGKTIEAGLVLSELRLRGLANRALILTPAGLVEQWREELDRKFAVPSVVARARSRRCVKPNSPGPRRTTRRCSPASPDAGARRHPIARSCSTCGAEATKAERARRLAEIVEKHAASHEILPFRLHLVLVPALSLPVDVRRGDRRYPHHVDLAAPSSDVRRPTVPILRPELPAPGRQGTAGLPQLHAPNRDQRPTSKLALGPGGGPPQTGWKPRRLAAPRQIDLWLSYLQRAGQVRPAEPGTGHVRHAEPGAGQIRPDEPGTGQVRPAEVGAGQVRPVEPGTGQVRPVELGTGEKCPDQVRP
jgi:SNF2-related domain